MSLTSLEWPSSSVASDSLISSDSFGTSHSGKLPTFSTERLSLKSSSLELDPGVNCSNDLTAALPSSSPVVGINSCPTGFSLFLRSSWLFGFLSCLVSNNATSCAREAACRVEPAPTPHRVTPGLERMGQQHIQHYQHLTDRYRHQQDTYTARILLAQVRLSTLKFWVYA